MKNSYNTKAEYYCKRGEELYQSNKSEKSIRYYLNSLLMERFNPKAYKGLGFAYKSVKDYDKAIEALNKAKNLFPYDYEVYKELGVCQIIKKMPCNAVKNFIRAIKLEPNNEELQLQLAFVHEMLGEEDMAIMIYQKIIECFPLCQKAYTQKASLLMKEERYEEAMETLYGLKKIAPDFDYAYLGLGICCDKLGFIKEAKMFYKKFLKISSRIERMNEVQVRLSELRALNKSNNFLRVVQ